MAQVSFNKVRKSFGRTEVVHGIDLEINSGELTVLLGPSGCGKSTLLRMIAGLEDVTDGDIYIDGEYINDTDASQRGCAMVFQNYALYPHQTVYKNIAFPLKMAGKDKATIDRKVREAARILQLDELLDRLPRDLSGGQRQRVAMGRAMIRQPKVYLFDEPLSNLDAELRGKMRLEIARLQRKLNATMVFVTHDQVEAMTLADRVVVMHDGIIEQVGAPLAVYQRPTNRFVAGFVGTPAMNFLAVERAELGNESTKIILTGGELLTLPYKVVGEPKVLGVRPEHVRIGAHAGAVAVRIDPFELLGTEHLGDRSYRYFTVPFGELTVLGADNDAALPRGTPAFADFDADNVHFFDHAGKVIQRGQGQSAIAGERT